MSVLQPSPKTETLPHLLRSSSHNGDISRNLSGAEQSFRHPTSTYGNPSLPPRYAHPVLHRSATDGSTAQRLPGAAARTVEHMLRRKTPNGVLSAAYDGSSTALDYHGQPYKHVLLPSPAVPIKSASVPGNSTRQKPSYSPIFSRHKPDVSPPEQSSHHPRNQVWDPGVRGGYAPDSTWFPKPAIFQTDSVLNQVPLQQLGQYPHNVLHGFMQPSAISPIGPTISNDAGPYGPYWPNGTFVPFRPATVKDIRFCPQHQASWQVPPGPAYSSQDLNRVTEYQQPGPLNVMLNQPAMSAFTQKPIYGHSAITAEPFEIYPSQAPCHTSPQINTSVAPLDPRETMFDGQSNDARLRENIFKWAHMSYVALLDHLKHETRIAAKNNKTMHGYQPALRPSIYPKPPRQRNYSFQTHMHLRRTASSITDNLHRAQARSVRSAAENPVTHPGRSSWPQTRTEKLQDGGSDQHSWPATSPASPRSAESQESGLSRGTSSLTSLTTVSPPESHLSTPTAAAISALNSLIALCQKSSWQWVEGLLLAGCLAYALSDYQKAVTWYHKILVLDPRHVEALSNLAATHLAMGSKREAEECWSSAIKLRPSHFEAVEHLVGLLCSEHRGKEAVCVIEFVERSLALTKPGAGRSLNDAVTESLDTLDESPSLSNASIADQPAFDHDVESDSAFAPASTKSGFSLSYYAIPGSDNGRMLQLVHAKGNMLYAMGENARAAKAFECAVLLSVGPQFTNIDALIKHIIDSVSPREVREKCLSREQEALDPVLLQPERAILTARMCFPADGELPGLRDLNHDEHVRKAAISTTSNSLLSLAKIFQDGMASSSPKQNVYQTTHGIGEILALYYLSLSLQPSPSTANNVGILLAGVQQSVARTQIAARDSNKTPQIPGVVPGSGVALALAYYNYGLNLDSHHAHLYTNLGSLLKDIGQLTAAIKMYEQAVACDGNFDIALANLANAVKDQNRIADAITYYRRAVHASPDFAEAVCGLANALNSVCAWTGRGGIAADGGRRDCWHVDEKGYLLDSRLSGAKSSGWIGRVVSLVEKQLGDGHTWGFGLIDTAFVSQIMQALLVLYQDESTSKARWTALQTAITSWSRQPWEGSRMVRLIERIVRRLGWQWYQDKYVKVTARPASAYNRPKLPNTLTIPAAPTVLPFHTFTCPMSARQIRQISQRNGIRISCSTLKAPWLPVSIYEPPAPPSPCLKVGYVSSDFNNHPLAHLMQSVFGLHDTKRVKAYCYATTAGDSSIHRKQIEREAPVFHDASGWPAERLVNQIVLDGIHILVNLNGYTRGARNEVFAARPAPIHMSFMGFAGTLGSEWCDYLLADEIAVPPSTLRPGRRNVDVEDQLSDETYNTQHEDWVYSENIIYCRDTFFCCDHRQSAPDAKKEHQVAWDKEQERRWAMRKEIFPDLPEDVVILGNFNQLYKIDPTTFRTWLRILSRSPNAILWLLRFPDLGQRNLLDTAMLWAGPAIAQRIIFTDVAPKPQHIARARVVDLFLDTPECNAHTTAADVLWSGTPLLTLPRYEYKMCSRMAASILRGAMPKSEAGREAAAELTVRNEDEYEEVAVKLASGLKHANGQSSGRLAELRKIIYEGRWEAPLFDTARWVRDLEEAYEKAWGRWVAGQGGDIWLGEER